MLLAFALGACQPAAAPDPLSEAREDCASAGTEANARKLACDTVLASTDLAPRDRVTALVSRGDANSADNSPTAALADYAAALALEPESAEAKLGRAGILLNSGQLDAAAPLIDSVIQSGALASRAHLLRGKLRILAGDVGGAMPEFDAAIAQDGRNAEAFAQRGLAKQKFEDYAAAERDFDAAIRLDSREPYARAGRCWNRIYQNGDIAAARADAEAAIAASPALVTAQLCLGLTQLRQQNWADARTAYDDALAHDSANAAALFGRGYARRQAGESAQGAADIRRAYEFNSHIDEEFERLGVDF